MDPRIKFSLTLLKFFSRWENQFQRKKKYYANSILSPVSTEEVVVIIDVNKRPADRPAGHSGLKAETDAEGGGRWQLSRLFSENLPHRETAPWPRSPGGKIVHFRLGESRGFLEQFLTQTGRQRPITWLCRVPSCPRALLCRWSPEPARLPRFPAKPPRTSPDIYLPLNNERK